MIHGPDLDRPNLFTAFGNKNHVYHMPTLVRNIYPL